MYTLAGEWLLNLLSRQPRRRHPRSRQGAIINLMLVIAIRAVAVEPQARFNTGQARKCTGS
jgi:hypothetical protein